MYHQKCNKASKLTPQKANVSPEPKQKVKKHHRENHIRLFLKTQKFNNQKLGMYRYYPNTKTISAARSIGGYSITFDKIIFDQDYLQVKELAQSIIANLTFKKKKLLFLNYGTTCSGKTTYMIGSDTCTGIIPEVLSKLTTPFEFYAFQILNDGIYSLQGKRQRMIPKNTWSLEFENLQQCFLNPGNFSEALQQIVRYRSNIQGYSTSHAIFIIKYQGCQVMMVDLAGGDVNITNPQIQQLLELHSDLQILSKCLNNYKEEGAQKYRGNKLIWMLSHFLKYGNDVMMLVHINFSIQRLLQNNDKILKYVSLMQYYRPKDHPINFIQNQIYSDSSISLKPQIEKYQNGQNLKAGNNYLHQQKMIKQLLHQKHIYQENTQNKETILRKKYKQKFQNKRIQYFQKKQRQYLNQRFETRQNNAEEMKIRQNQNQLRIRLDAQTKFQEEIQQISQQQIGFQYQKQTIQLSNIEEKLNKLIFQQVQQQNQDQYQNQIEYQQQESKEQILNSYNEKLNSLEMQLAQLVQICKILQQETKNNKSSSPASPKALRKSSTQRVDAISSPILIRYKGDEISNKGQCLQSPQNVEEEFIKENNPRNDNKKKAKRFIRQNTK